MKKVVAIWLCLLLTLCLTGCGNNQSDEEKELIYGSNSVEAQEPQSETGQTNEEVPVEGISAVESAYSKACSLTMDDLETKTSPLTGTTFYYYRGLAIQTEDVEWLTESWNTEQSLNQGALYRSVASYLEGFESGINTGKDYAKLLCGIEWSSRVDFDPYATNAAEFICSDNSFERVMKKLETVSCVSGDFDYEGGKYHFVISDLTDCADEMMISEEMLGYIFAWLEEYAPEISFDGNSCTFAYERWQPNAE